MLLSARPRRHCHGLDLIILEQNAASAMAKHISSYFQFPCRTDIRNRQTSRSSVALGRDSCSFKDKKTKQINGFALTNDTTLSKSSVMQPAYSLGEWKSQLNPGQHL